MDRRRFKALAEAYGGDVTRWPQAERNAALRLLQRAPALAMEVLAPALRLDMALDSLPAPRPSEALKARVLAAATAAPVDGPRSWRRLLAGAGVGLGLSVACATGFMVGSAAAHPTAEDRRADAALSEIALDAPQAASEANPT
jgi:hypothetical protein